MEGSVLGEVGLGVLDVDTVSLGDGGVSLDNVSDLASVSVDELGSPVANVSETLDDEILVLDAKSGVSHLLDEAGNVQQLSDGVVHSQASGLGSSSDSSVGDVLASAAAFIVDVGLTLDILVSVLDPGHHLLVSSHVRTEAINLGPDEALLDQLKGVSAGHALELGIGELSRVDSNTTLGATEGNIGNGELESHETSEGLDFLYKIKNQQPFFEKPNSKERSCLPRGRYRGRIWFHPSRAESGESAELCSRRRSQALRYL
mmetsp:Transcript_2992/g.4626  ORF Transcript_2992/g.4626 Transcript_2992/m.4626 type:complete len:260 (-) Transcript_2992:277-1056(-)